MNHERLQAHTNIAEQSDAAAGEFPTAPERPPEPHPEGRPQRKATTYVPGDRLSMYSLSAVVKLRNCQGQTVADVTTTDPCSRVRILYVLHTVCDFKLPPLLLPEVYGANPFVTKVEFSLNLASLMMGRTKVGHPPLPGCH